MKSRQAPTLGIMPKEFYEDRVRTERLILLKEAISRYLERNCHLKPEWIEEYNELIQLDLEIFKNSEILETDPNCG